MANLILWSSMGVEHAPVRACGPTQLASWLRQHGYTVKVIDFCHLMTTDQLVAITDKHIGADTIAVGVSSTFWDERWKTGYNSIDHLEPDWVLNAREVVERKHKLHWLLGGGKSNFSPYKCQWIKMHGFAEDELLRWLDQNSGRYVRRELFDITCMERFSLEEDYIQPDEPLTIELTRGCKFKCKFCSYPLVGKKPGTYMRDPKYIREEFIRNYDEWGTTNYYFQDDTVNESLEKVQSIVDIVQSLPFELNWIGYNRLDLIGATPGMAQLLKDSGLRSSHFGIESFHRDASRAVGKGWNGLYARDYLLELRDMWGPSINWYLSFITGLPGEPEESVRQSHQWCKDNEMYSWSFFGLNISSADTRLWRSEFEINATEYGYKFPIEGNTHYWENGDWNAASARALGMELNAESTKLSKPSCWLLTELVGLGYTYEQIMSTSRAEHDWEKYRQQTKEFVEEYVSFQLR